MENIHEVTPNNQNPQIDPLLSLPTCNEVVHNRLNESAPIIYDATMNESYTNSSGIDNASAIKSINFVKEMLGNEDFADKFEGFLTQVMHKISEQTPPARQEININVSRNEKKKNKKNKKKEDLSPRSSERKETFDLESERREDLSPRSSEREEISNILEKVLKDKHPDYVEEDDKLDIVWIYHKILNLDGDEHTFLNSYQKLKKEYNEDENEEIEPRNYGDRLDLLFIEITENIKDEKNDKLRENIVKMRMNQRNKDRSKNQITKRKNDDLVKNMKDILDDKKMKRKGGRDMNKAVKNMAMNMAFSLMGVCNKDIFKRELRYYVLALVIWNIFMVLILSFIGFI